MGFDETHNKDRMEIFDSSMQYTVECRNCSCQLIPGDLYFIPADILSLKFQFSLN